MTAALSGFQIKIHIKSKEFITMETVNRNKLKIKDIITVVLLALINVVLFFASSLLYATPITIILMPVFFCPA